MKIVLALCSLLLLSAQSALAQTSAAEALTDFDFVTATLRQDYAGFPDKTAGDRAAAFEAEVEKRRAAVADKPDSLFEEVWALLGWFKDGHLALDSSPSQRAEAAAPAADPSRDAALASAGRRLAVAEADVRKRKPLAGPAGIWETIDGGYRVAVVPDPDRKNGLAAVILTSKAASWSPGQVKFELAPLSDGGWSGVLRLRDHSERTSAIRLEGKASLLTFVDLGVRWRRVWPEPAVAIDHLLPSGEFSLRPLTDKTLYLRLPDFRAENRERIEKLLSDNSDLLNRTPNLLIDLRNNGGGSDASYTELMKWIYSRPIYSIGLEYRASKANADAFAELLRSPDFPDRFRPMVESLITRMRAAPDGGWVSPSPRPFSIRTFPEIRPNPKRVGILITGAGSSGDQFVLDARQSRKVTTFGGNTAGVIDYSNQLKRLTPSGKYWFKWASSRSLRLPDEPIDGVGIAPDIRLGGDVDDPVAHVQRWLERQVD